MVEYVDTYTPRYEELCKASTIYPRIKVELLDSGEGTIGEIVQDIAADSAGTLSINYQQGTRRSCSLTLIDDKGLFSPALEQPFFGFNTKFKLYLGLMDPLTSDYYWFSQGIFYVNKCTGTHNINGGSEVNITASDKFSMLDGTLGYNQMEGTYVIPAQQNLYQAIYDILHLEMGAGRVLDPKSPVLDPLFKDCKVPYEIRKSPGGYIGDIVIELANILGADVFYDTQGRLNIVSGTTDLFYSQKSSVWDFSDTDLEYMNSSIDLNTVNAINSVRVVGSQISDGLYYIGIAENNNPASPTAIDKIGRKMYYEDSATLPTQQAADEYARYILKQKSIIQTTVNFSTTILPHLDVNQVVTISDNYYKYDQERFIIQSYSIPLGLKTACTIGCCNISTLPYYELRSGGGN